MTLKITGTSSGKWQFAIDRGGTFTDVIGIDPDGNVHTTKLLSQATAYRDAALEGIRRVLGLGSERRVYAPYGLAGGRPGVRGRNLLVRRNGQVELLPGKVEVVVQRGEKIVLKTPGGGGYGDASLVDS